MGCGRIVRICVIALIGYERCVTASGFPAMHDWVIVDTDILIDAARGARDAVAMPPTLPHWTGKRKLAGNRFRTPNRMAVVRMGP